MSRKPTDPAQKRPLSKEEIRNFTRAAGPRFLRNQSPVSYKPSKPEWVIIGVILIVLGALYVQIQVKPILPIKLPAEQPNWFILLTFLGAVSSVVLLFVLAVMSVFRGVALIRLKMAPPQPRIVCASCGAGTPLRRYQDGGGCRKCGSRRVYCGRCGKSTEVEHFTGYGGACPHCGFDQAMRK